MNGQVRKIGEKAFNNLLKKIMEFYGDYTEDMMTEKVCTKKDRWTPCDLILREWYNNGGGSARGFLGISPSQCEQGYWYILEHKNELLEKNYISKDGWNNSGFSLWKNYNIH